MNEDGAVIDLLRLDRYQDGELVAAELLQFLESITISQLTLIGETRDVSSEDSIGGLLEELERRGLARRSAVGSIFMADRP